MAVYVEDRYLNSQDSEFVNLVNSDIQKFLLSIEEKADQVLLFPPVSSYHRFLIHKTVEDFPVLCSFSIGDGDNRRSIICLQELVLRKILSADTEAVNSETKDQETAESEETQHCGSEDCNSSVISSASQNDETSKSIVNDCTPGLNPSSVDEVDTGPVVKEVSQPSASTVVTEKESVYGSHMDTADGHTYSKCSAYAALKATVDDELDVTNNECKDIVKEVSQSACSTVVTEKESVDGSHMDTADGHTDIKRSADTTLQQTVDDKLDVTNKECTNGGISAPAECSDSESKTDATEVKPSELSASVDCISSHMTTDCGQSKEPRLGDAKITESADGGAHCDLNPALMNELSLAVGVVRIVQPDVDYESYLCQTAENLSEEDYGRLVEIYDFPEDMITRDLLIVFRDYRDKFFDIKWVDKTHAIGIFSSQEIAQYVLSDFEYPLVKVRPIHLASDQTKEIVRKSKEIFEPYKPRPETSTATASNLVHGALGLRRPSSKEHKRHSRKSSDEKHHSSKSKRRVWDGKLRPCAMDLE